MALTPDQRQAARLIIRRYLEKAEGNQPDIHYSQARPLTASGEAAGLDHVDRLLRAVHSGVRWADLWSAFTVKDPGGFAYAGWGFTGTILSTNRKRTGAAGPQVLHR